ncbi:MAG: thioredoxin-disulfide reductase [Desulfobacterales bacterium]|nr:MAG: thioredoxin-disulfide reductase [Desulfobacterales bacterium]
MKRVDYDLVIIGGGPAGLTAGLYAARAEINTILIEKVVPGGQVNITDFVDNYPGFPDGISGPDLVKKMTDQVERFGLEIENNEVISVDLSQPIKNLTLNDRSISTHTVIIATGASPKKLGVPGEEIFSGKGVSYCATCDGPFFKDRVIAAVGGGDTAVEESLFLTRFAKKVYLIHRRDQLRAAAIMQHRAMKNDKIEMIWNSEVTSINGLTHVENITVQHVKTSDIQQLHVDGCFIWVGIDPVTQYLANAVEFDKAGFVRVDLNMETSVPGVFAAGDVRNTSIRQIATAVGDAAVAAYSAEQYIENILK